MLRDYTCYTKAASGFAGSLIGFTNLGDINNHLTDFENSLKEDKPISAPPATSMPVLMIRGLRNNFSFPYAQFPCNDLSGYQLCDIFWEAVCRLELCGLKVMALVCDGLSANRRLFNISSSSGNTPYEVKN
uniref:Transposable element P transposase-like RNase H domain-containing protein n=1 Tax=Amphimedon queenslandica TaxID=400682 RepID=A0A1X7U3L7_AMPQE